VKIQRIKKEIGKMFLTVEKKFSFEMEMEKYFLLLKKNFESF
jgi:hypothetical protein